MSQHTELRGKLQRMAIECGARLRGDDWCFDDGALENFYRFSRAADALQALERVPMTTADMVNVVKAAGWPADTNDRQLVAAFNLIEATEAHHGITPPEKTL